MAVSVIVGLSGAPHGSYCTFSDTLGNSINRPVLPRVPTKRKEESLVSTSTLHFSGAVVTLRRALKIAEEFASSGGSRVLGKSKVTLKSASGLGPAGGGDLRGVARSGNALFRDMEMPSDRKSMSDRLSNTPGKRDRLAFPVFSPQRRRQAFQAKPWRGRRVVG